MKKFTRREFIKLSSVWGIAPFAPKGMYFKGDMSIEEAPSEDISSSWHDEHCDSPYFLDGGVSVRYWPGGDVEVLTPRKDIDE